MTSSTQDLLYGVLALRNDFIGCEPLAAAVRRMSDENHESFEELLRAEGQLNADDVSLLKALVERHLRKHGHDVGRCLAAIQSAEPPADLLSALSTLETAADAQTPSTGLSGETIATAKSTVETTPPRGMTHDSSAGRFRIVGFHAKGGLGEVYLADDGELRRRVALKQIQQQHAHDPASRARFVAEAEITGGLEHPGIVPVYGLGQYTDGRPYYAMRFIQGDNLDAAIRRFHRPAAHAPSPLENRKGAGTDGSAATPAGRKFNDQSTVSLRPIGATDTAPFPGTAVDVAATSEPRLEPRDRAAFASLAFRELLGRFIDVCHAVDYAHSRGVVHRDLKPQNIMLGDFGETLVVDWGLAKIVGRTDSTFGTDRQGERGASAPCSSLAGEMTPLGSEPTTMGQVVGTPRFMSPEQAAGRIDVVGPASDVYSLGATLYSLLTGRLPMAGEQGAAILTAVQEGRFAPPRRVNHQVPAALEAICLKAMSLAPAKRYATAADLARDVERWLADEPVSAFREPWIARCLRWGRRHRTWVAGAGALLLTLTAALGVGLVLLAEKQHEILNEHAATVKAEAEATRSAARAVAINNFLLHDLLAQADPGQNARDKKVTVEELLDKAADRLDRERHSLAQEPEVEATLRTVIGGTYVALDAWDKAERQLVRAEEIAQRDLGAEHSVTLAGQEARASLLEREGKFAEAETLARHVWETRVRLLGAENEESLTSLAQLALYLDKLGRLDESQAIIRQCVEDSQRVMGQEHPRTLWALNTFAMVLHSQGKLADAVDLLRQLLEAQTRVFGRQHPETLSTTVMLGTLLREQGNIAEAETLGREAVATSRQVLGEEHANTIVAEHNLALLLHDQGNLAEAEPWMREVLDKRRRVLGDDHPSTLASMNSLAVLLRTQGNLADAQAVLGDLVAGCRRALGPEHPHTLIAMNTLAVVLRAQNKLDEAEPLLRELLTLRRRVLPGRHPELGMGLVSLGLCLLDQERGAEAEPLCEEALSIFREAYPAGHPMTASAESALGEALLATGKATEAEPLLRDAVEVRSRTLPPEQRWQTAESSSLLGACLAVQGHFEEAEPLLLSAFETLQEAKAAPPQRKVMAQRRVIALYEASGQIEKADEWRTKRSADLPSVP
jgi:serine/threonine protein kinase